jgi:hypothetical protein
MVFVPTASQNRKLVLRCRRGAVSGLSDSLSDSAPAHVGTIGTTPLRAREGIQ